MKSKVFFLLVSSLVLISIFIMHGCGSAPTSNLDSGSGTGTLTGVVKDTEGSDISGVSVTGGGKTVYTDYAGAFDLGSVPAGVDLIVEFSRTGFVTTQKKVQLFSGSEGFMTQYIMPIGTTTTTDDAADGVVSDGNGSVKIYADTLEDADGHDVTGSFTVNFTSFDPLVTGEFNAFPGDFAGRQTAGGTDEPFETFGYVNITITQNGGALDLKPGSTAEVHIPIPTSLQATAPSPIDLWSYNEDGGYWVHEGVATKEGGNTYYIAVVTHFSYWNCDQLYNTGYISGEVVDHNGVPVAGAYIRAIPVDWLGSPSYWNTISDADGKFGGLAVKAIATTQIYARKAQYISTPETITGQPPVGVSYPLPYPLVLNASPEWDWWPVGVEGFSAGSIGYNSLFFDNDTPYIAYTDAANSNKATVMKYNGVSWESVGDEGFSAAQAYYISLFIYSGTPYVAYQDGAYSSEATVMKYNSSLNTWEAVGDEGFSGGGILVDYGSGEVGSNIVKYTSLYVYDGIPYIAFQDPSSEATVMKYNSALTTWEVLGARCFSAGDVSYTSLSVYNGTPYVSYQDVANGGNATVMKYNGSAWEDVGSPGFSAGNVSYVSLFVYNGTPYVAYMDGADSNKATVMKYNGSAWENVGSAGFSTGAATYTSLFVYNGTPYVAYRDAANSFSATVMKYNGSAWEDVGGAGFSTGAATYTSLFVYNGTPYVSYQDVANSNKATVMKYGP
ncbi:carboxypeptidase-like regulatory domain-containing protein [Candidatus Margulisiibacteriota bacterium]